MNTTVQTHTLRTVGDAVRADKAEVLISDIKKRIAEAALFRGMDIPSTDIDVMARTYYNDLRTEFRGLDLAEINQIIRCGIRKEWGEFYGLNAGTLYDWTRAYLQSDKREAYVAQRRKTADAGHMLAQRNEKSQADIDAHIIAAINDSYGAYVQMVEQKAVQTGDPKLLGPFQWAMRTTRYPIGHPLCDLGSFRETWLHEHGFTGTLEEIFARALEEKKERII